MAAYCRVSTDQEEQLLSYENQVNYYTKFIKDNPLYTFAGVYADEGISATNTKKREEFNRMIADCREGKIDMIITKSISRFARNTLDCLNYVRELKELGIGILFEKENINTLDAKGEVLLTILSSLAQDESRSISENSTWGIRRRFETGKHKMSTKRFLGYDSDETGKLIVNSRQAKIVVRLFQEFLDGKTTDYIKRIFEREGVVNWDGSTKWHATTMNSMLQNEKYKGDALLQKSYTVDFLTKKRAKNSGEVQMYYVEDDHEAGHSHTIDEHVWTSPVNEMTIIHNLASLLETINPEEAVSYEANAEEYIGKIEGLDHKIREVVDNAPRRTLIFASRFPLLYFVREYDLDYYAAFPGCAEETEPSAKTVAFLIDKAEELDVPCILNIELSSDMIARVIASEAGCGIRTFNTLHNVTAADFHQGKTASLKIQACGSRCLNDLARQDRRSGIEIMHLFHLE